MENNTDRLKEVLIKSVSISDKQDYQTAYNRLFNAVREFLGLSHIEINKEVLSREG